MEKSTLTCFSGLLLCTVQTTVLSNGMSWAVATPSFIPTTGPEVTETLSAVTNATRFYRVKATPPLQ
jgi:hypothetical protein